MADAREINKTKLISEEQLGDKNLRETKKEKFVNREIYTSKISFNHY